MSGICPPTNNAVRRDARPLECGGDFRHGLQSMMARRAVGIKNAGHGRNVQGRSRSGRRAPPAAGRTTSPDASGAVLELEAGGMGPDYYDPGGPSMLEGLEARGPVPDALRGAPAPGLVRRRSPADRRRQRPPGARRGRAGGRRTPRGRAPGRAPHPPPIFAVWEPGRARGRLADKLTRALVERFQTILTFITGPKGPSCSSNDGRWVRR